MERDQNKVTIQEAAEALNKISLYCEETRCSKCIFRRFVGGDHLNKDEEYRCILGDYHPYLLRFVTNDGGRVVTEWDKENLENEN